MKFYLGTHLPHWLNDSPVPLFVSRRRLIRYRRSLPRAAAGWALDSGGFTEIAMHGHWTLPPAAYAAEVRRYRDEVGHMDWAAPQDWMCEDVMLAKTGLTVADHQRLTTDNYLELRSIADDLPFVPVIQGQTLDDYRRHADLYLRRGVDLTTHETVGIGSVCRRQATNEIVELVEGLTDDGLRLHGFGMKMLGLAKVGALLASSDSMSWSFQARKQQIQLPGCTHRGVCANCRTWALRWRADVVAAVGLAPRQMSMFGGAA